MNFRTLIYPLLSVLLLCPVGSSARNSADSLAVQTVADTLLTIRDSLAVPADKVNLDSLAQVADSLRRNYMFQASCDSFDELLSHDMDSLDRLRYREARLVAQNGLAMASFTATPEVVTKKRFPLGEFYLYYPLADKAWRQYPNVLDTLGARFPVNALYFPEGDSSLYYAAHDETGARNLYFTQEGDSLWTVPALLNEGMTSSSNEIFPMLSADKKKLYFSSDGLFGAGGYDLYVSVWNEEQRDWGEPENLGFPYSSPANDYLYMDSPDGQFTLFASDRECSPDSVWIYVLEYDNLPIRKEILDPEALETVCRLEPENSEEDTVSLMDAEVPENLDIRRYMDKIAQVNALRDTIFSHTVRLDQDRNTYAVSSDEAEMEELTRNIEAGEHAIHILTDSLTSARKQLQDIEMEFLFSGVVIDPQKLMEEADKEEKPERKKYNFKRMERGEPLVLLLQKPEIHFDYTFRIEDSSTVADTELIPEGLVYQIQMVMRKTKADVGDLKGISPVFEVQNPSGGYIYKAGVFNTYSDALSKLNQVKKKGFRYAKIVASENGKSLTISAAREREKTLASQPVHYEVLFDGEALALSLMEEIKALSGKDLAKGERDGKIVYIVGPFDVKSDAEMISGHLVNNGVGDVVLHEIEK